MSSKKNNFNSKDHQYMSLALNLARENQGLTGDNPSVGCVIVKNDDIISFGKTGLNGRPHAEFNAIKNCKSNLTNSILYVTMEPCTHYGKTSPCTKLIIKSKIKKVIYSIDDVDPRTSNKAFKLLKKNKLKVKKGILHNEFNKFYTNYFYSKKNKLPYVIGKIACSKDNFIKSNKSKYITCKSSLNIAHLLRYRNQAILISYKTLNSDNPKLNCRLNGLEKFSPTRFILDKQLKTKKNSYIEETAKQVKTYIFYNHSNKEKINYFKEKGIKLIKINLTKNNLLDLKKILTKIYKLNINTLLVEGGANLTNNFLQNKLFNEFYLFKSDVKLMNKGSNNVSALLKKLPNFFKKIKTLETFSNKDKIVNFL
jgi:diaminohydroxyphosphoribosylaminopyrimidine deaminase/5-amino-6-(5-phosphoribosylamino)uracil reductase